MAIVDNDLKSKMGPDGAIQLTRGARKLTIDGQTKHYSVYKIKLSELRYNVQNDRIATWVCEYTSTHDEGLPDDVEALNEVIENFIVESNPEAIKKTQDDIERNEQQEPAVVLNNGVLIDGNRRFTCLRRLAKEDPRFGWIEAVVLPPEIGNNKKAIKMLELAIQHGKDSKVDYNPIDRLVGVYNDVLVDKLLTPEEYARVSNVSVKDVDKMLVKANYLVDFLDFINAPKKFYLAREMNLNGPLSEMEGILKYTSGDDEQERVKNCIFANLVMEPTGDMTRFIRKFKNILKSQAAGDFIDKECELTEKVIDKLETLDSVSVETIRENLRSDVALTESFENTIKSSERAAKGEKLIESAPDRIASAAELIDKVEIGLLKNIDQERRAAALRSCKGMQLKIAEIIEFIEEEQQ